MPTVPAPPPALQAAPGAAPVAPRPGMEATPRPGAAPMAPKPGMEATPHPGAAPMAPKPGMEATPRPGGAGPLPPQPGMEATPAARIQIGEDSFIPRAKPSIVPKVLGVLALLIVGGAVGGYFYYAPESHIAMTWTEDPALPELIYNTVHDKRRDYHGSQVMCREFAMWSEMLNDQLIKAGPKAPELAKKAYLHWEPIDSAFNALTNLKPDPGDAADTLAICWKHVKSMGQYIDDVAAGRIQPDKRIEPWMRDARDAARDR